MSPYRASSAEGTRNFSLMHPAIDWSGALGKQPEGNQMRNQNQLRAAGETMEQFKARRARGVATNIMGFMAECREGAGWGPAKAEMIQWFHSHRARLHQRLALATRLP